VALPPIVPAQFSKVLSIFFICHTLGIIAYILPKASLLVIAFHSNKICRPIFFVEFIFRINYRYSTVLMISKILKKSYFIFRKGSSIKLGQLTKSL
jgi:hypothetical protein